eukprot:1195576-Prorocentrum_minimum.AAC.11
MSVSSRRHERARAASRRGWTEGERGSSGQTGDSRGGRQSRAPPSKSRHLSHDIEREPNESRAGKAAEAPLAKSSSGALGRGLTGMGMSSPERGLQV